MAYRFFDERKFADIDTSVTIIQSSIPMCGRIKESHWVISKSSPEITQGNY